MKKVDLNGESTFQCFDCQWTVKEEFGLFWHGKPLCEPCYKLRCEAAGMPAFLETNRKRPLIHD
jgi:hypothetical protein